MSVPQTSIVKEALCSRIGHWNFIGFGLTIQIARLKRPYENQKPIKVKPFFKSEPGAGPFFNRK